MKLGLALGGGGARGSAHIGVLIELERLGLKPVLITGTSIGGLIGALWAAGLTPEDITAFFQKLNLGQMYALPEQSPSLSSNKKIKKLLEDTLGPHCTFADLKIPLSVVATDLVSRQVVVLDEGDLITAVLATIAIPTLLPPVEMDGMVLVDGGVLNSTPFDVVRARGATFVIAVDLTNTATYGQPDVPDPNPSGVISRMLIRTQQRRTWQIISTIHDIITSASLNTRLAVSRPEILLRPDLGTISVFDYHRWEDGIAAGRAAVLAVEQTFWPLPEQEVKTLK